MGCWILLIETVHCGSNSILKVRFLGHPVHIVNWYPFNFHFFPQQNKVLNLLENIFYSIFCTVDFSLA